MNDATAAVQAIRITNTGVEAYLAADAVTNLFPLWIARQAPIALAIAAVQERDDAPGGISGALVFGSATETPFVPGVWVVADTKDAARALFRALAETIHVAHGTDVSFVESHLGAFHEVFPHATPTFDAYCVLRGAAADRRPAEFAHELVVDVADPEVWPRFSVPEDVASVIGDPSTLPPHGLYGLVVAGTLVAIADTFVNVESVATIQQVYATRDARNRGYASCLVDLVGRRLV